MDEFEKWMLERINNEQMLITRKLGDGGEKHYLFAYEMALDKYQTIKSKSALQKLEDILNGQEYWELDELTDLIHDMAKEERGEK